MLSVLRRAEMGEGEMETGFTFIIVGITSLSIHLVSDNIIVRRERKMKMYLSMLLIIVDKTTIVITYYDV